MTAIDDGHRLRPGPAGATPACVSEQRSPHLNRGWEGWSQAPSKGQAADGSVTGGSGTLAPARARAPPSPGRRRSPQARPPPGVGGRARRLGPPCPAPCSRFRGHGDSLYHTPREGEGTAGGHRAAHWGQAVNLARLSWGPGPWLEPVDAPKPPGSVPRSVGLFSHRGAAEGRDLDTGQRRSRHVAGLR